MREARRDDIDRIVVGFLGKRRVKVDNVEDVSVGKGVIYLCLG
jgi:hypothetical protein